MRLPPIVEAPNNKALVLLAIVTELAAPVGVVKETAPEKLLASPKAIVPALLEVAVKEAVEELPGRVSMPDCEILVPVIDILPLLAKVRVGSAMEFVVKFKVRLAKLERLPRFVGTTAEL